MPQDLFILRPEHEDAFAKAGLERFKKYAVRYLRERYRELMKSATDTEALDAVDYAIEIAHGYGLRTEYQMINFMQCSLLLDDHLDSGSKHVDVIRILAQNDRSPDARSESALALSKQLSSRSATGSNSSLRESQP